MTEVAIREPAAELAVPSDIDSWVAVASDVIKLANQIADTPFVPDGLRGSVPATAAAILAGRELGLGPMTSLANVHVIKGKPALSAALMRALILAQGHQIETLEISDTRAVVRGRRKGEATWEEASFTADQAKRAAIQLGGYPQDKLYARATSRLARRKFADVIAGMPYSAEELEDGGEAEHTEPVTAEPAKPAQRTAQRRQRAAAPKDTPGPPGASQQAGRDRQPGSGDGGSGAPQPPLPGEEEDPTGAGSSSAGHGRRQQETSPPSASSESSSEPDDTDYDTPGTITRPQLTKLHTVFTTLGFGSDERDQKLVAARVIVGRELESSKDLSLNEAKTLIDTLERCGGDREKLIALLAAAEGQARDDA